MARSALPPGAKVYPRVGGIGEARSDRYARRHIMAQFAADALSGQVFLRVL
jgi:hypothetical protein